MHVIPGYPSLSNEARGVLKFLWRKSHVKDDWTKGGEISDAWDRWSIFPWYMYPRYDLEWSTRVVAKIANEIPAWREGCTEIIDLMLQRMTQYAAWFDLVEQKGLDPNRAQYPYDYYDKNMPPGWAGVYNAPRLLRKRARDQGAPERGEAHLPLHAATRAPCRSQIQSGSDLRQRRLLYDGQGIPAQYHCSL